jgi:hypothetical protein
MSSDRFSCTKERMCVCVCVCGGGAVYDDITISSQTEGGDYTVLYSVRIQTHPLSLQMSNVSKHTELLDSCGSARLDARSVRLSQHKTRCIIHTSPQNNRQPIHFYSNTFCKHHHLHKVTPILHSYVTLYQYMRRHV